MAELRAALQTMHLTETLAVALYHGPQPILAIRRPDLHAAFVGYEQSEVCHRSLFLTGLHSLNAKPFWFARLLALVVGFFAFVTCLVLGLRVLLWVEITIERIAIAHYGKILQSELPDPWPARVNEVRDDEIHHLEDMRAWLHKL